jgi:acyl carrier protein
MMQGNIEAAVRKFIAESFMYREGVESLKDTDSLLDQGLIDSTGVLELVFFLEKTFAIKVKDDEVVPENLDSVSQIAAYIRRKVPQPPQQAQPAVPAAEAVCVA